MLLQHTLFLLSLGSPSFLAQRHWASEDGKMGESTESRGVILRTNLTDFIILCHRTCCVPGLHQLQSVGIGSRRWEDGSEARKVLWLCSMCQGLVMAHRVHGFPL